jgi:hypothetical protein
MHFFKDPIYFRITPLSVYITNNSQCKTLEEGKGDPKKVQYIVIASVKLWEGGSQKGTTYSDSQCKTVKEGKWYPKKVQYIVIANVKL